MESKRNLGLAAESRGMRRLETRKAGESKRGRKDLEKEERAER